ncbi:hypothetical protein Tco_1085494, partial [Tanacetum coccineum]
MPNVDILQGMDTCGSPRRQDTMRGAPAQTRSERVLDLKKKKDAQAVEILRLKKRVKGLERQRKSSTSQPRRRKYRQVESSDDDLNEEDASKQGKRNDKTKLIREKVPTDQGIIGEDAELAVRKWPWRNKPDLDSKSFDENLQQFKIDAKEVKRTVTSSSNSGSQNVAFVSTPSSTNEVNTANVQVSTDNTLDSTANLSDAKWVAIDTTEYESKEVLPENWEELTLSMEVILRYDKSKEPRKQARNQDSSRRTVNVETFLLKQWWLLMEHVLIGATWQMRKSLPSYGFLRFREFNKSKFNLATYKRGLASVEDQLVFYKKNKVMFCDQIAILKRDASFKDSEINALNTQIEKLKKEKESNPIKINNFENAFKSLDKLIGSQISDNNRNDVGYNAVPPLPTCLFAPLNIDLSNSGLKEFQQPEFKGYRFTANKGVCENSSNEIKKTIDAPIIEDWVSDCDKNDFEVK